LSSALDKAFGECYRDRDGKSVDGFGEAEAEKVGMVGFGERLPGTLPLTLLEM
jgi:hypothetical protein